MIAYTVFVINIDILQPISICRRLSLSPIHSRRRFIAQQLDHYTRLCLLQLQELEVDFDSAICYEDWIQCISKHVAVVHIAAFICGVCGTRRVCRLPESNDRGLLLWYQYRLKCVRQYGLCEPQWLWDKCQCHRSPCVCCAVSLKISFKHILILLFLVPRRMQSKS